MPNAIKLNQKTQRCVKTGRLIDVYNGETDILKGSPQCIDSSGLNKKRKLLKCTFRDELAKLHNLLLSGGDVSRLYEDVADNDSPSRASAQTTVGPFAFIVERRVKLSILEHVSNFWSKENIQATREFFNYHNFIVIVLEINTCNHLVPQKRVRVLVVIYDWLDESGEIVGLGAETHSGPDGVNAEKT